MVNRFIPATLLICIAVAQPAKAQLGARQLFYDEGSDKKTAPVKPVITTTPVKPKSQTKKAPPAPKPAEQMDAGRYQGPPEQVSSSVTVVTARPLGLRYSILKVLPSMETMEVDADSSFRTGDKIQVVVQGNQPGYLYIFSEGTSGNWSRLFPSESVEGGDNHIGAMKPVLLPSEQHTISFSGKPGTEKLFILFSRNPNEDIDRVIYQQKNSSRSMIASSRPLPGSAVDQLKLQTRDLVIESVKGQTSASNAAKIGTPDRMSESAIYVATKDATPSAKVVAEIRLKHE